MRKLPISKGTLEGLLAILVLALVFGLMGSVMGPANLVNTIMKTAYDLLLNTVLYLIAITVVVGAFSAFLIEFGVVRILERILAPLMKPVFRLPGVASLGAVMCFLSDSPAVLSLVKDKGYRSYFKKIQLYSLTNFAAAFGMGLIVISYVIGQGQKAPSGRGFYMEALIGLLGAFVGAFVSSRFMQFRIRKEFGDEDALPPEEREAFDEDKVIAHKETSLVPRLLNALLDGGKSGLDAGISIVPGVLVISTAVMMLSWGPKDPALGYQGLAYEGVPVLAWLGTVLAPLFDFLFGFTSPVAVAFPATSLGSVGAALGLIPRMLEQGLVGGNDIAVFTAIGMCWSGFLSSHTGILDAIGRRDLIGKDLGAHALGGLAAGVAAHYLWLLARLAGLVG